MSETKGLTLFILFTTLVSVTKTQDACVESKLCYCQNSDSTFIDLSPIGSKRLQVKKGLHNYELQLCEPFALQGDCVGVFGCEIRKFLPNYVSLGNTAHFKDSFNITYTGGDVTTVVQLFCINNKEEPTLDFLKESPKKTFHFLLQSKYACPQDFPTTSTLPPSDSTQDTTSTDSTAESGESTISTSESSTETTSEITTDASESTAATSELTTGASEPTATTNDLTTQESEPTTATSEVTTDASETTTSEATSTTVETATTDTPATTTHGDACRLSSLTTGTILLLAMLLRTLL